MKPIDRILTELDDKISQKHLLKHTFYQAWSRGELSAECLRDYAEQYYAHVKAFPGYVAALLSHTEEMQTCKELLQNLVEELGGSPNHPELWKSFAIHLGSSQTALNGTVVSEEMQQLIKTFQQICREESVAQGLAALYAYESQIPAICISKIEGLKNFYGMQDPEQWRYFSVHIAADEEHARVERHLLEQHLDLTQSQNVLDAAERVLDALWNFLTHLCHKHKIAC
jgi:pyrroloquinoline-quinone synthase